MEIKEEKLINIYFKLFPEIIMHNHTYRLKRFVKLVADEYDKRGKKIIDIGAGSCQYRDYFKKVKYFSQDVENNKEKSIDFVCNVKSIPVKRDSFDYILCTQVLEHLKDPHLAFEEFRRILKKGGKLFLTTHMAFEEHMAPIDYFRFTRFGLRYLAESNGFRVEKIEPQGGRFIVLAKELQILVPRLVKNKYVVFIFYFIFSIPLFFLSLILFLLDFLDEEKALTLNYECIFV